MDRVTFNAIVTAAAIAIAPVSAAAEPRAGLLPLDVEGKLPPKGKETIGAEIEAGLQGTGATVVPAGELSSALGAKSKKAAAKKLAACRDATCLQGLATKVTATHLVRPTVRMEDSDYVISLELVDGATGEVVHQASQNCELCGLIEAQEVARSLAASLEDRLENMGTVAVQSTPPGAEVLVDGEPAGTAPLELRLAAGEHSIVLRLSGHADEERRVVVEVGSKAALDAELASLAPVPDPKPARDRGALLRPLGWTSLGLGVASLGSGIALLVLDENPVEYTRCSGSDVDAAGNWSGTHDTLAGGVVMTVIGVVGITAGAVLVARARKGATADDRRARVRPTLRGFAIQF